MFLGWFYWERHCSQREIRYRLRHFLEQFQNRERARRQLTENKERFKNMSRKALQQWQPAVRMPGRNTICSQDKS